MRTDTAAEERWVMATADELIVRLRAALSEERAANAESLELAKLSNANLKRRRAAEEELSNAHAAIEEYAEKSA
jgi:hypothetical protein